MLRISRNGRGTAGRHFAAGDLAGMPLLVSHCKNSARNSAKNFCGIVGEKTWFSQMNPATPSLPRVFEKAGACLMRNPPEKKILILGAALPAASDAGLRSLCQSWEAMLIPWLMPEQLCHIRRFAPKGAALSARASRLLARLLLLRGLQVLEGPSRPGIRLGGDAWGRPLLPGWRVCFSHSGQAAFCALCRGRGPGNFQKRKKERPETGHAACSVWEKGLGLDAEALNASPPAARAFTASPVQCLAARDALRRWTIKEAALKALGTGLRLDPALIQSGLRGQRAGLLRIQGQSLFWRVLACPGHWLCLACDEEAPPSIRLRWLNTAGTGDA